MYEITISYVQPIADRVAQHLEILSKNFQFSTMRTRILMRFVIYCLVIMVNPMGRILVRWKSFRNNVEMLCHPICNWLYQVYIESSRTISYVFELNATSVVILYLWSLIRFRIHRVAYDFMYIECNTTSSTILYLLNMIRFICVESCAISHVLSVIQRQVRVHTY